MVADSQLDEEILKSRSRQSVYAKLSIEATEVNVSEEVNLVIEVVNAGEAPVLLIKTERIVPLGLI
jgi:hypothetical protein